MKPDTTDREDCENMNPRAASLNDHSNAILRRAEEEVDEDALDFALPFTASR